MKQRELLPERMDSPDLAARDHEIALRGLSRINRWTNLAGLVWKPIAQLAVSGSPPGLRVLDLATGAADLPIELFERARQQSIAIELEACDISPQALRFAAEKCQSRQASIRLFQLDAVTDPIPDRYDVIVCTTFLHHLQEDQVRSLMERMAAAARKRIVVVDLIRGRMNWMQVWLASRVLSRSPIVHYDGPQSIQAAFTMEEIRTLADSVGFKRYRLNPCWPCRFVLVGDVGD